MWIISFFFLLPIIRFTSTAVFLAFNFFMMVFYLWPWLLSVGCCFYHYWIIYLSVKEIFFLVFNIHFRFQIFQIPSIVCTVRQYTIHSIYVQYTESPTSVKWKIVAKYVFVWYILFCEISNENAREMYVHNLFCVLTACERRKKIQKHQQQTV